MRVLGADPGLGRDFDSPLTLRPLHHGVAVGAVADASACFGLGGVSLRVEHAVVVVGAEHPNRCLWIEGAQELECVIERPPDFGIDGVARGDVDEGTVDRAAVAKSLFDHILDSAFDQGDRRVEL